MSNVPPMVFTLTLNFFPRSSFFEVISHFGPAISAIVVNRHRQRDIRLITEARNAIATHSMDRGPEAGDVSVRLSILLELHTVLCTEYRYVWSPTAAAVS